jgi:hypothetical protein
MVKLYSHKKNMVLLAELQTIFFQKKIDMMYSNKDVCYFFSLVICAVV